LKLIARDIVFCPDKHADWMWSHASFPAPLVLSDRIRIFFGTRSKEIQSSIAWVDVERKAPFKVIGICPAPVLSKGRLGTFDDCGVTPDCAVVNGDKIFLYYHGWNRMQPTPHRTTVGLAISSDGGTTFERYSEAPLFERCREEPFFSTNPSVMKEGDRWHMWYMAVTDWLYVNEKLEGLHHIKYASSDDGIEWQRHNKVCIVPSYPMECLAGASVLRDGDGYIMLYCKRSAEDFRDGAGAYRLGIATSKDAIAWDRKDEQLEYVPSGHGWDSTMQAYPSIVEIDAKRYVFFNGNGFGLTGIAYAELL
jgi:predicted GH43/DUF377 family glycosyl hydrolase